MRGKRVFLFQKSSLLGFGFQYATPSNTRAKKQVVVSQPYPPGPPRHLFTQVCTHTSRLFPGSFDKPPECGKSGVPQHGDHGHQGSVRSAPGYEAEREPCGVKGQQQAGIGVGFCSVCPGSTAHCVRCRRIVASPAPPTSRGGTHDIMNADNMNGIMMMTFHFNSSDEMHKPDSVCQIFLLFGTSSVVTCVCK
mmetsp:Transcript_10143/g.22889  ORF Transcript_10143/g.22889 Transcript_10143/m.22889 type:complete len:193 (-) Transcript_10143:97-675(-)